jgi:hypothetical protein
MGSGAGYVRLRAVSGAGYVWLWQGIKGLQIAKCKMKILN